MTDFAMFFAGPKLRPVIESLRSEPEKWSASGYSYKTYNLNHLSGLQVWVGNSAYGMAVQFGGVTMWGGVTFASTFGVSVRHWVLWAEARKWMRANIPAKPTIASVLEASA